MIEAYVTRNLNGPITGLRHIIIHCDMLFFAYAVNYCILSLRALYGYLSVIPPPKFLVRVRVTGLGLGIPNPNPKLNPKPNPKPNH